MPKIKNMLKEKQLQTINNKLFQLNTTGSAIKREIKHLEAEKEKIKGETGETYDKTNKA